MAGKENQILMIKKQKKYLSQNEAAVLLGLPEVTVQRWIHQGKIPSKIISKETVLIKKEVIDWAKAHDLEIKHKKLSEGPAEKIFSLAEAIKNGGIFNEIEALDITRLLKTL